MGCREAGAEIALLEFANAFVMMQIGFSDEGRWVAVGVWLTSRSTVRLDHAWNRRHPALSPSLQTT